MVVKSVGSEQNDETLFANVLQKRNSAQKLVAAAPFDELVANFLNEFQVSNGRSIGVVLREVLLQIFYANLSEFLGGELFHKVALVFILIGLVFFEVCELLVDESV